MAMALTGSCPAADAPGTRRVGRRQCCRVLISFGNSNLWPHEGQSISSQAPEASTSNSWLHFGHRKNQDHTRSLVEYQVSRAATLGTSRTFGQQNRAASLPQSCQSFFKNWHSGFAPAPAARIPLSAAAMVGALRCDALLPVRKNPNQSGRNSLTADGNPGGFPCILAGAPAEFRDSTPGRTA